jgi:hypothetical protein
MTQGDAASGEVEDDWFKLASLTGLAVTAREPVAA